MAVPETTARATAAVDELYRRHVGDVYRYTYAVLGNHADAEDVTQTTFVNALRAMERGESPEEPERWLMVIAHNLVRQRWRQAAARPTVVELETDVPDAVDEDEQYELEELVRALQRIPETQREALVMRELEGRSYRDIAAVMGLTTSALETVLFRARRSLADELENVVTCQNAELAISKRLDGRLSRKERRRLEEHLAECPDCARLAAFETRQRKAFKGLALLPLPVGLALFKGAPSAAAATSLPTIGLAASGGETAGVGAAGAGTATGGAAAGGSLAGGLALKVAAIAATITVAAGVGYKGVQALRDDPSSSKTAAPHVEKASTGGARLAAPATPPRTTTERPHTATKRAVEHRPAVTGSSPSTSAPLSPPSTQTHGPTAAAAPSASTPSHTQTPVAAKSPAAPEHPSAPTDGAEATPKPGPVASPGRSNGVPKTSPPKAGTTSPGGDNGSGSGSGTTGGGTTTPAAPPPATPPNAPPGGSGVTPPTVTPPASSPPATTPEPPATPPTTTPPSTPPATPPSEQPPGDTGSGSTGGDTSGSTGDTGSGDGSPSQGTDPWEQGQKNGHHKGNHDDKHPGDS